MDCEDGAVAVEDTGGEEWQGGGGVCVGGGQVGCDERGAGEECAEGVFGGLMDFVRASERGLYLSVVQRLLDMLADRFGVCGIWRLFKFANASLIPPF